MVVIKVCSFCEEKAASVYCDICPAKKPSCEECFTLFHAKPEKQSHVRISIRNLEATTATSPTSSSFAPLCFAHKEKLKYFCTQCSKLACANCFVVGEHKNHKICSLEEQLQDTLKQIDKRITDAAKEKEQRPAIKQQLEHQIEENRKTRKAVESSIDVMIQLLQVKKEALLADMDEIESQHKIELQKLAMENDDNLVQLLQKLQVSKSSASLLEVLYHMEHNEHQPSKVVHVHFPSQQLLNKAEEFVKQMELKTTKTYAAKQPQDAALQLRA